VHPTAADFFAPENTEHRTLIEQDVPVWEILNEIPDYLKFRLKPHNHGRMIGNPVIGKEVYIGEGTIIEPGVYVQGPAWIGRNCQIRQGAYIRSNVIVGDECVLGNSSEFKNCLLLNRVQAPHFNYVGDSILGYQAHIGAGVILSNLRSDQQMIKIHWKGERFETGRKKIGAILGDGVEVGCNAVLNPGTLAGPGAVIHPGVVFAGSLFAGQTAPNPNMVRGVKA
jgi:NDP-sugar pyrophosphorylase family protein